MHRTAIIVKSALEQTTTELKQIFTNKINKFYFRCILIAETSKTELGHPKQKLILILIGKKLTLRCSFLKKMMAMPREQKNEIKTTALFHHVKLCDDATMPHIYWQCG